MDDLVMRELVCRGIKFRDKSEIDFYRSCRRCTVCETNSFVGEIQILIPDKAFLSKYLLLHQLFSTKHFIESILSYHGGMIY